MRTPPTATLEVVSKVTVPPLKAWVIAKPQELLLSTLLQLDLTVLHHEASHCERLEALGAMLLQQLTQAAQRQVEEARSTFLVLASIHENPMLDHVHVHMHLAS